MNDILDLLPGHRADGHASRTRGSTGSPDSIGKKAGRTAETVRPITGMYTRFTFCP